MSPDQLILTIAIVVGGILIGRPLWKAQQRRKLRSRPLPQEWRGIIERFIPLYAYMPANPRTRLNGLVHQFLAEKQFVGCGGLKITLEMKIAVAAQACLLVSGLNMDLYENLHSILLYPATFIAPQEEHNEAGVVTQHQEALTGQAWGTHKIILSWEDVAMGVRKRGSGYNVTLHEFAHCLDAQDGCWSKIMQEEYERLRAAADRNEETLLDPYGTEAPAEFFAVATESFFEQPAELKQRHPALYSELMRYYLLDPALWIGPPSMSDIRENEPQEPLV